MLNETASAPLEEKKYMLSKIYTLQINHSLQLIYKDTAYGKIRFKHHFSFKTNKYLGVNEKKKNRKKIG